MVDKYVHIRDATKHEAAVKDLLPRGSAHRRILALHGKPKELNSYPVMGQYLDVDTAIVHSPVFQKAVIKIGSSGALSSAELETLEPFRASTGADTQEVAPAAGFSTEELRHQYIMYGRYVKKSRLQLVRLCLHCHCCSRCHHPRRHHRRFHPLLHHSRGSSRPALWSIDFQFFGHCGSISPSFYPSPLRTRHLLLRQAL
ncbi:hypothetical protein JG688_00004924 [Phytophthora aleatoria]|uniref:Uncharacterized protein n=1 Tax=Phytophthora aleatoria TaxID=2496075 RepID=A0A8J5INK3_9STRA|nr:hypothetical protein JG688_00004924 [Phytophthora aleatoria]